jgi:uncharacterized protein
MSLPARTGLGFKPEHFADICAAPGAVGFYEVHAENYMGAGGAPHAMLARLRDSHALSLHGVGLSIGGAGALDPDHLGRLKALVDRYQPESFSEHLAWSSHGAAWLNDLLPLPYTDETLGLVCDHVDAVQEALGRRMLLENPATYVTFAASTWAETDFLAEIVRRTGCGLLLDVNNVFVSATNHRFDARAYLARSRSMPWARSTSPGTTRRSCPRGPFSSTATGGPSPTPSGRSTPRSSPAPVRCRR